MPRALRPEALHDGLAVQLYVVVESVMRFLCRVVDTDPGGRVPAADVTAIGDLCGGVLTRPRSSERATGGHVREGQGEGADHAVGVYVVSDYSEAGGLDYAGQAGCGLYYWCEVLA